MAKNTEYSWLKEMGLDERGLGLVNKNVLEKNGEAFNRLKIKWASKPHVLFVEAYPTHFVALFLDKRKVRSSLSLIAFEAKIPRLVESIEGMVSAVSMVEDEGFQKTLSNIKNRDLILKPMVVESFIRGALPQAPQPSSVDLLVKSFDKKPRYSEDFEGNVDYSNLNLFQNILSDQHIANKIEAKVGRVGKDVFGHAIPVEGLIEQPIQCGKGVAYNEAEGKYYASFSGYLLYEDRKLSIEDTYVIEGNVDLSVGHTSFIADILVRGHVHSDFYVRAEGKLEIHGTVTGASLEAKDGIDLRVGVLGQGKSILKSGRFVKSKFVNEARVEAEGDIVILTEALNSHLSSLQEIKAAEAVFIGGRIVAQENMEIGTIGSELGFKTELFLGENYRDLAKTEDLRSKILATREEVEMLYTRHYKEIKMWQEDGGQVSMSIPKVFGTQKNLELLRDHINELLVDMQEYELLSNIKGDGKKKTCRVNKMIYSGATFFYNGTLYEVKKNIRGPVLVTGRRSGGKNEIVIEMAS